MAGFAEEKEVRVIISLLQREARNKSRPILPAGADVANITHNCVSDEDRTAAVGHGALVHRPHTESLQCSVRITHSTNDR